jgi:hypothetical protein
MKQFIEVTHYKTGEKHLVNISIIEEIIFTDAPYAGIKIDEPKTCIFFMCNYEDNERTLIVKESYEEIKGKLGL